MRKENAKMQNVQERAAGSKKIKRILALEMENRRSNQTRLGS